MEKKQGLLISFIAGAAIGAAIGYLLSGEKGEQLVTDLKQNAGKVKDELDKQIARGKEVIDEIKAKADEIIDKVQA